jgi:hypothetical protein
MHVPNNSSNSPITTPQPLDAAGDAPEISSVSKAAAEARLRAKLERRQELRLELLRVELELATDLAAARGATPITQFLKASAQGLSQTDGRALLKLAKVADLAREAAVRIPDGSFDMGSSLLLRLVTPLLCG